MLHDTLRNERKETRELQIRYNDHHAEQEDDGVEVDGAVGFVERQRIDGHHEAGADDGRTGAIHAKAGQAADREHQVGQDKDDNRDQVAQASEPECGLLSAQDLEVAGHRFDTAEEIR
jgi:hypothetical protein